MSVLKCKMCGGDLEVLQGMSVCECIYCGSKQTLPKMGSEKKNNLYDRASHFRRSNEYDKAMAIYEQILNEEAEDSETYWSILLCRYGIEYVEDPATHKRVPTVNRAQMTSIFVDEDYKAAIKYADAEQKSVYEAEAKEIDRIQKSILEISSKEEPFDVFICYKETDSNGRRTEDSVLANDLYHQLTQEGFRVFFARITLEDKLGAAYEPYIFAALNSAKVMVVLGTKAEHFNAVWVKNEWSRYLALIKSGAKKILIPAYKNMDPYDLPEEFSHLQAQDMNKLGFMQDLIRGIKKLAEVEKKPQETTPAVNYNAQPLIERAFLFLEDGDFARADELCEQALNQDPKNARAYVGKLMVERKIRKQEELSNGKEELSESNYFQKAIRFAEDSLRAELERCNEMIVDRKKEEIYQEAKNFMKDSENAEFGLTNKISMLENAINNYKSILGFREDIDTDIELAENKIQQFKNEEIYRTAKNFMTDSENSGVELSIKIRMLQNAINNYKSILGFREDIDSDIELAEKKIQQFQKMLENKKNREKQLDKMIISILCLAGIVFLCIVFITKVIIPKINYIKAYKEAEKYVEEGNYDEALSVMDTVAPEEAYEIVNKIIYDVATKYKKAEDFLKAKELFDKISTYEDSEEQIKECIYMQAITLMDEGEYKKAKELFDKISTYKDSEEQIKECIYIQAITLMDEGEYKKAKEFLYIIINSTFDDSWNEKIYKKALTYEDAKEYMKATELFDFLSEYKDCADKKEYCYNKIVEETYDYLTAHDDLKAKENLSYIGYYKNYSLSYALAIYFYENEQYQEAKEIFDTIWSYAESAEYSKKCDEEIKKSSP